MKGEPERIAKGTVVEVIREFKKQKRDIYLMVFGSRDEIYEFSVEPKNIQSYLKFLQSTFNGGTDFKTPINRAVELITNQGFENADILMITDGIALLKKAYIDDFNVVRKET